MFVARKRNGEVREIGLAEMVERQNRLASVIAIAKRGMADLIRSISGKALVFLTDADGYILHAEGSRAGMFIGQNFFVEKCGCCDLPKLLTSRKPEIISCERECFYHRANQRMVIAPVHDDESLAAVLGLSFDETEYSPVLIEFIRYLVDSISRELAVNRAYSRLATSSNYLTILADLAYSMNEGKVTEQTVLEQVVGKLAGIARTKASLIAVVDSQKQNLIPVAFFGQHQDSTSRVISLSNRDDSAVASFLSHKTVLTMIQQGGGGNQGHYSIATPVTVNGKVKGVIAASTERDESFDQETVAMFEIAAGLVGIILENLALHEQAEKEQTRLIQLLENVNEAIALVDSDGLIVRCNATFSQWFSELGAAVGTRLISLTDYIGVDLGLLFERLTRDFVSANVEFALGQRFFHLRMEPSLVGSSLDGVIIIISDTSEARHFELVKAEILATISHELRTPVTAIQGYVDLIEIMPAALFNKEQNKLLVSLKNEVKALVAMVEKIVAFNHFQLNQYKLPTESLPLAEIIKSCINKMQNTAQNKSLSIVFEQTFSDIRISGDAWGITEVISDLLDNAIKFSKIGGQVAVGLDVQDNEALIDIIDTGEGIPIEERERIFEQFYRGEETAAKGIPGSGLGLYVSRYIVQAFGGEITVEDAKTGGTKFTVILPLERDGQDGTGASC